jgi:hypothetical protein
MQNELVDRKLNLKKVKENNIIVLLVLCLRQLGRGYLAIPTLNIHTVSEI